MIAIGIDYESGCLWTTLEYNKHTPMGKAFDQYVSYLLLHPRRPEIRIIHTYLLMMSAIIIIYDPILPVTEGVVGAEFSERIAQLII